jgi:hypothetical protein
MCNIWTDSGQQPHVRVCRKAACRKSAGLQESLLQDCSTPEVVAVAHELVGVREHLKVTAAKSQARRQQQACFDYHTMRRITSKETHYSWVAIKSERCGCCPALGCISRIFEA